MGVSHQSTETTSFSDMGVSGSNMGKFVDYIHSIGIVVICLLFGIFVCLCFVAFCIFKRKQNKKFKTRVASISSIANNIPKNIPLPPDPMSVHIPPPPPNPLITAGFISSRDSVVSLDSNISTIQNSEGHLSV